MGETIHEESLHPRGNYIKLMTTLVAASHPWLRHDAKAIICKPMVCSGRNCQLVTDEPGEFEKYITG